MSGPAKRPIRTYGRPKDAVLEEASSSLQPSGSAWGANVSISELVASHFAAKTTQAPTSSRHSSTVDVADGQTGDEEGDDASASYKPVWMLRMEAIDKKMDEDGEISVVANTEDASRPAPEPVDGRSPTIMHQSSSPAGPHSPTMQETPRPIEEDDVFGGSAVTTSHVASGDTNPAKSRTPPVSPQPNISHRRGKQRAVVYSSDDSEDDTKSSARKPRTTPHPIASPKLRSSSTPPTSDDEMPAQLAPTVRNSLSKEKDKPSSSRGQVPPLQFNDRPVVSRRRTSDAVPSKSKLKAPTKKDKLETVRERGRMAGAQRAAVQHVPVTGTYTLGNLFRNIQTTAKLARTATAEDPISSFSSSPGLQRVANVSVEAVPLPLPETTIGLPEDVLRPLENSDDEMPAVGDLLHQADQAKTKAEMQRELMEKKLKLAAHARPAVRASDSEDDDDLEVVGPTEAKKNIVLDRTSAGKHKPSEGRKMQLALGGISLKQQREKLNATPSKPLASAMMTQEELKKEMAKKVKQTNAEETKRKEDEWVKRGGQRAVGGSADDESARSKALKVFAEQGQKNAEAREARMQVDFDEDDNASDEDWAEERGSASPRAQDYSDEYTEDADTTMVNEDEAEDDDDDAENEAPSQVKTHGPRRTRVIVDSDSENDENAAPFTKSASPFDVAETTLHRGSVSSMDERTEDEGDKENNTSLMYDRSEDKENRAVPRHPLGLRPGLGRQGSLFGLEEGMQRSLSMSPGNPEPMSDDENDENDNGGDKRRPLQNLLSEDPFLSEPGPSPAIDFAARLQQASPLRGQSLDSPESTLRPSLDSAAEIGAKGFSQFSDDESMTFKGAPLQPGFSDLFDSTAPKRPLGPSASFSAKSGLHALRNNKSLGLTQDVELQPAFEVDDHLKRQGDAVFEKEQEFIWEAGNKKSDTRKPQLYVNDHGFLTQTRPDGDEPEIYQPSSPPSESTQKSNLLDSQSSLRRPPTHTVARGICGFQLAFRVTAARAAAVGETHAHAVAALEQFESVGQPRPAREEERVRCASERAGAAAAEETTGQIRESDDDEMMAYNRTPDDGEEEDGEDLDRTLETLVDDKEMDEDTVAADRVLEKFQEHAHEDDLANEKLQQAVVQGELRKKRRNRGLGLDDSDEEDSEDEARKRKMRRGLHEPKITGDVTKLADNPATAPFYHAFRKDLDHGDDAEFAYLQESQPQAGEDVNMDSEGEGEGEKQSLTRQEFEQKVRELARREYVEPTMDDNDVSWIDGEDNSDGEQTRVKAVSRHREGRSKIPLPGGSEREHERMNQWAKQESRSRNMGTGRASGRTAVTGQNARAKAGGGSVRAAPQAARASDVRRSLGAKPSVLAVVASDRSTRFEL
ncbi:MRC1 domain-containing protein [Mycena sanguinolenta]|uniref:MRC1 domain-containing protein n=1 Tax=Mycena sanguinolenta TaxID=230812 RepID=A0A8H7CYJ8_9AGAR|nr:MRC1 domain-containing protein [Mycena sanguinolenta]